MLYVCQRMDVFAAGRSPSAESRASVCQYRIRHSLKGCKHMATSPVTTGCAVPLFALEDAHVSIVLTSVLTVAVRW